MTPLARPDLSGRWLKRRGRFGGRLLGAAGSRLRSTAAPWRQRGKELGYRPYASHELPRRGLA